MESGNLKKSWQYFVGLSVMLAISFHVAMTFIYLVPGNVITRRFYDFNSRYMAPLFAQNWHLFSPNPGFTNTDLWIRCTDESGKVSSWQDPFRSLVEYHHKTRVTGVGKLLYIYEHFAKSLKDEATNSAVLLAQACSDISKSGEYLQSLKIAYPHVFNETDRICEENHQKSIISKFVKSAAVYEHPKRFAQKFCQDHFSERSIGAQIRVVETFPKKFSERSTRKTYGKVDVLDLGPDLFSVAATIHYQEASHDEGH